ncbi:unnamed protein product, partial [Protopolystoma xenopodis]
MTLGLEEREMRRRRLLTASDSVGLIVSRRVRSDTPDILRSTNCIYHIADEVLLSPLAISASSSEGTSGISISTLLHQAPPDISSTDPASLGPFLSSGPYHLGFPGHLSAESPIAVKEVNNSGYASASATMGHPFSGEQSCLSELPFGKRGSSDVSSLSATSRDHLLHHPRNAFCNRCLDDHPAQSTIEDDAAADSLLPPTDHRVNTDHVSNEWGQTALSDGATHGRPTGLVKGQWSEEIEEEDRELATVLANQLIVLSLESTVISSDSANLPYLHPSSPSGLCEQ